MSKEEIKAEIKRILEKIQGNMTSAYEHDLNGTREVVVLEDFNSSSKIEEIEETKYNGWLEDLMKLAE